VFSGDVKASAQVMSSLAAWLQPGIDESLSFVHGTGFFPGHWRLLFGANALLPVTYVPS
jgi:hypothetical protein